MTIQRILVETHIGETRALALDQEGRPAALFQRRWTAEGRLTYCGEIQEGIIREHAPTQGGWFLELANGQEAFLAGKSSAPAFPVGQRLTVETLTEAQNGKRARVKSVKPPGEGTPDPLRVWMDHLNVSPGLRVDPHDLETETVQAAFEDALSFTSALPKGGYLRISPTPALTAIDVDTAGRVTQGRAKVRAHTLNLEAAGEAARQLLLRNLAGTVVLDCVAPLAKADGLSVKQALLVAYRARSKRRIEALMPSPFGLLQAAIARHGRPLHETALLADRVTPSPETLALEGLRHLVREAARARGAHWVLALPEAAFVFHKSQEKAHRDALINRFGARIEIICHSGSEIKVYSP